MSYPPGHNPYRIYREQQLSNQSPGRLVLLAYDTALRACRTGKRGLLTRVLHELIAGLDLDQGEVAAGLLLLYEYALSELRAGNLDEVRGILEGLREAWAQALRVEESKATANPDHLSEATVAAEG